MTILEEKKQELITLGEQLDAATIKQELDFICEKLEVNMLKFGENFPSACCEGGKYRIKSNDDWTNGFWTAMLWMAYEYTGKAKFKDLALKNTESFIKRLDDHFVLDHHDIGFLYSLSLVADYKINGTESLKAEIVRAATVLVDRFHEDAGFIQAWGAKGNPDEYRLIIDSLLNLPLLYSAFDLTGEAHFQEVAERHYRNVVENIIRSDYSTFHTFYFDPGTKLPDHGATHQGFSDDSCWARGQAWAIMGIPLHLQREAQDGAIGDIYGKVTDYYLERLPQDLVPYWDLAFKPEDKQSRDSSSNAISACGLMIAASEDLYPDAMPIARGLVKSLVDGYTSRGMADEDGILLHGVYAYAHGKGIDQANLWGDYYYMEALMRLNDAAWKAYW